MRKFIWILNLFDGLKHFCVIKNENKNKHKKQTEKERSKIFKKIPDAFNFWNSNVFACKSLFDSFFCFYVCSVSVSLATNVSVNVDFSFNIKLNFCLFLWSLALFNRSFFVSHSSPLTFFMFFLVIFYVCLFWDILFLSKIHKIFLIKNATYWNHSCWNYSFWSWGRWIRL